MKFSRVTLPLFLFVLMTCVSHGARPDIRMMGREGKVPKVIAELLAFDIERSRIPSTIKIDKQADNTTLYTVAGYTAILINNLHRRQQLSEVSQSNLIHICYYLTAVYRAIPATDKYYDKRRKQLKTAVEQIIKHLQFRREVGKLDLDIATVTYTSSETGGNDREEPTPLSSSVIQQTPKTPGGVQEAKTIVESSLQELGTIIRILNQRGKLTPQQDKDMRKTVQILNNDLPIEKVDTPDLTRLYRAVKTTYDLLPSTIERSTEDALMDAMKRIRTEGSQRRAKRGSSEDVSLRSDFFDDGAQPSVDQAMGIQGPLSPSSQLAIPSQVAKTLLPANLEQSTLKELAAVIEIIKQRNLLTDRESESLEEALRQSILGASQSGVIATRSQFTPLSAEKIAQLYRVLYYINEYQNNEKYKKQITWIIQHVCNTWRVYLAKKGSNIIKSPISLFALPAPSAGISETPAPVVTERALAIYRPALAREDAAIRIQRAFRKYQQRKKFVAALRKDVLAIQRMNKEANTKLVQSMAASRWRNFALKEKLEKEKKISDANQQKMAELTARLEALTAQQSTAAGSQAIPVQADLMVKTAVQNKENRRIIDTLMGRIRELDKELKQTQAQLENKTDSEDRAQGVSLKELEKDLATAKAALSLKEQEALETQKMVQNLKDDFDQQVKVIEEASQKTKDLYDELENAKATIGEMATKALEADKIRNDDQKQAKKKTTQVSDLEALRDKLMKELEKMRETAKTNDGTIQKLKKSMNDLETALNNERAQNEEVLSENDNKVTKIKNELNQAEINFSTQLQNATTEANQRVSILTKQVEELKNTMKVFEENAQKLSSSSQEDQIAAITQTMTAINSQIQSIQT